MTPLELISRAEWEHLKHSLKEGEECSIQKSLKDVTVTVTVDPVNKRAMKAWKTSMAIGVIIQTGAMVSRQWFRSVEEAQVYAGGCGYGKEK